MSKRLKAYQASCDVRSAEQAAIPLEKQQLILSCLVFFFFILLTVESSNKVFGINFENVDVHN